MADSKDGVRVEVNEAGLYQVRIAPRVRADLEARARKLADKCNRIARTQGFKTSSVLGQKRSASGGRWRTTVITAGAGAIRHNAAHNTLINNMDAAK